MSALKGRSQCISESHRTLMYLLEELINFLNKEKIQYWIDWGTMLGFIRHGNVIPWDYDCDLCMLSEQYDQLVSTFAERNESDKNGRRYRIGRLLCLPDAYKDDGCLWVQDAENPESHLGIDVIRYRVIGSSDHRIVKNCMNEETCTAYPCTIGSYDFAYEDIFPLRTGIMVGLPILLPNRIEELVVRGYGPDYSKFYPHEEYLGWLDVKDAGPENESSALEKKKKFLGPPFKTVKQFRTLATGLDFYRNLKNEEKEPFLVYAPPEFSHLRAEELSELFKKEQNVLSWHETETELFNDSYHLGQKLYQNWLDDELKYNVVDAPNNHLDLLPLLLKENLKNMRDDAKEYSICYALTKQNNLTKYHEDVLGDGWVYLKCGRKIWHIISRKDVEYLEEHGYPLISIKDLNFTELVTLLDGYLWSKVWVGLMGPSDFIYFPECYAHRVITYDKSFGICGYTKT